MQLHFPDFVHCNVELIMDIDTKSLRCFIAVAEARSFSNAARAINMAQPTLSARISSLEKLLGVTLFARSTRSVELTPAGLQLFSPAMDIIRQCDQFADTTEKLRNNDKGRLVIGASFYTLDIDERVRLIDGFVAENPEASIIIDPRWQQELFADLEKGKIDCVLMIGMPIGRDQYDKIHSLQEATEVLYPSDMRVLTLNRKAVSLLVPEESPLAETMTVPLAALENKEISMLSEVHGAPLTKPIMSLIEAAGARAIVPPESHGIGVERYGRQFRIPAISLGWFDSHKLGGKPMVRRSLEGLTSETRLCLIAPKSKGSVQMEAFWRFA
ncbi:MAG: LysR family transcriptional regulator, partial [Parvibaculaceae bacterium]|nr:LysR family transcriptional regulator [Parvibaculaceae bacterium]